MPLRGIKIIFLPKYVTVCEICTRVITKHKTQMTSKMIISYFMFVIFKIEIGWLSIWRRVRFLVEKLLIQTKKYFPIEQNKITSCIRRFYYTRSRTLAFNLKLKNILIILYYYQNIWVIFSFIVGFIKRNSKSHYL